MIEAKLTVNQEVVYYQASANRHYRRVVGGLAWPGPQKPGWLVVLGEELLADAGLQARRLWLLAEREGAGIDELFRAALALRRRCQARLWVGDTTPRPAMARWRVVQRDFPPEAGLPLSKAVNAGERGRDLYQMIDNLVMPERKVLYFGQNSRLAGEFQGLQAEDLTKPAGELPGLAALGYAAGELVLFEPVSQRQKQKNITAWNPYTMEVV